MLHPLESCTAEAIATATHADPTLLSVICSAPIAVCLSDVEARVEEIGNKGQGGADASLEVSSVWSSPLLSATCDGCTIVKVLAKGQNRKSD